jgi:hypothetical protein
MRFFYGILWILGGMALMKYSFQIVSMFGKIPWAERVLGGGLGGTYLMWKLVGIIFIIIGFLTMSGGILNIISPLAPFFGK